MGEWLLCELIVWAKGWKEPLEVVKFNHYLQARPTSKLQQVVQGLILSTF